MTNMHKYKHTALKAGYLQRADWFTTRKEKKKERAEGETLEAHQTLKGAQSTA